MGWVGMIFWNSYHVKVNTNYYTFSKHPLAIVRALLDRGWDETTAKQGKEYSQSGLATNLDRPIIMI